MSNEVKSNEKRVDLKEAKKWLQRNDLTEIAKEVGVTRQCVSMTIAGRFTNWIVAEKIVQRAEHNKAIKERAAAL